MPKELNKNEVYKIIKESLNELNNQGLNDYEMQNNLNDDLFGGSSPLDSLGLVSFLVIIEQSIENKFGINITIADEKAFSLTKSPFKKISSLVDYLSIALKIEV